MQDRLLVLNFDDFYAGALAVKLRAERIDCAIVPGDTPIEELMAMDAMGWVLAGSAKGTAPADMDGRLLSAGKPVLAMGDTALGLAQLLGGELREPESLQSVESLRFLPSQITQELPRSDRYMNVLRPMLLPEDMNPLCFVEEQVVGFAHATLPLFGFAFQIETNDPDGADILLRFAQDVCGCSPWRTDSAFIAAAKAQIASVVGEGRGLCVMTGGLDSGVAALLAQRVLGDRLQCIFIDTGLLRENEAEDFLHYYQEGQQLHILRVNAQERFLAALEGLTSPSEKSAVISKVYDAVLNETAAGLNYDVLVRGTSANDVLHNGDGFQTPGVRTDRREVQPLAQLFKEEIRRVGEALGMPQDLYQAQPFPGTGLALRIMGEVSRQRLAILRKADAIFREEVRQAGLNRKLWKYFAVLYHLNFEPQHDALALALRAVTIGNVAGAARALPARLPNDMQDRCAARIMQAFPEVMRVVNDITPGASYAEIEWR